MSTGITVKRGDTHDISWDVNADLTGCTVRLLARPTYDARGTGAVTVLAGAITESGATSVVQHTLLGTLAVGAYFIEIEITDGAGKITTAPTRGHTVLTVEPDLG